jgi:glyoxylase-like metal-dependent hydrolase (beta-lactamase superfamily II)
MRPTTWCTEPVDGRAGVHRVTDQHVNAWIVEHDDGLVLVDCGLPGHQRLLDGALHELGPRPMPTLFAHDPVQAGASLEALAEIDAVAVLPGHGEALLMTPQAAVTAARGWTGSAS